MDQWEKIVERIQQATGLAIQLDHCPSSEWERARAAVEQNKGEVVRHTLHQGHIWYISITSADWSQEARALLSLLLAPSFPVEQTATELATSWLSSVLDQRLEPIPASLEAKWQWREPRACFLIERLHANRPADVEQWQQLLQQFFPSSPAPMLLPLSPAFFLLLVPASALPEVDGWQGEEKGLWLHWGYTLHELLVAETMEMIRVGITLPIEAPSQLPIAVKSGLDTLRSVQLYRPKEMVAADWQFPLEKWAYSLPAALREQLHHTLGPQLSLSDEQQEVLHALFSNQLNVSETARALFLHRNTLLYRLDKLKEKTGLDPREFSDAVFLRLAMLFRQIT
ncbi:PucR family transcriptional regulator [Brevibacillus migulae]|uniref:PucR family transcriptional regulator n=1 Tax=Brevibacillus migulae TaxID=1644114 RepID=UPI00106E5E36|nr:helix-turn-helix domain-containing protein [Brevibacillus migulae]